MNDDIKEIYLTDPLTEHSRKLKRNLLAASVTSIVVVKLGLVPTKIENLGIDFAQTQQDAVVMLLALITAYYLLVFYLNAFIDGKLAVYRTMKAALPKDWEKLNWSELRRYSSQSANRLVEKHGYGFLVLVLLRGLTDFGFPIFLGLYAIILLLTFTP